MKNLKNIILILVILNITLHARWETAVIKEIQFFSNGDVKALIIRDRNNLNLLRTISDRSHIFKEIVAALLCAKINNLRIKYERDGKNFKNIIVGTVEILY